MRRIWANIITSVPVVQEIRDGLKPFIVSHKHEHQTLELAGTPPGSHILVSD